MALTKESMALKIQNAIKANPAPPVQGAMTPAEKDAAQLKYLESMCEGIINELTTNGLVVGTDSPTGDSHSLNIT